MGQVLVREERRTATSRCPLEVSVLRECTLQVLSAKHIEKLCTTQARFDTLIFGSLLGANGALSHNTALTPGRWQGCWRSGRVVE